MIANMFLSCLAALRNAARSRWTAVPCSHPPPGGSPNRDCSTSGRTLGSRGTRPKPEGEEPETGRAVSTHPAGGGEGVRECVFPSSLRVLAVHVDSPERARFLIPPGGAPWRA